MIIHAKSLIFVHIQKTAGDSICTALGAPTVHSEKHFSARELRESCGADVWQAYFKFAFVRNPWDRLVSWWSMIDAHRKSIATGTPLNKFQQFVIERASTFEEFLENCDEEIVDDDGRKWIYRNQLDYLTDLSGQIMVDFIGRFESLPQDYAFIAEKIPGGLAPLPHVNVSRHRHYSDYYTPALADKVARRYQRDIAAFGYIFKDHKTAAPVVPEDAPPILARTKTLK
jgi:hypothetical protein